MHNSATHTDENQKGQVSWKDLKVASIRLRLMWQPFWKENKRRSTITIGVIVALMISMSALYYFAAQVAGEGVSSWFGLPEVPGVTDSMQRHYRDRWWTAIWIAIGVACLIAPVVAQNNFVRNNWIVNWFEWFSHYLTNIALSHGIWAKLKANKRVDNPEQILDQSVENMISGIIGLSLAAVLAMIDVIFGFWSLSQTVAWEVLLAAVVWSVLGSVAVPLTGRPLVTLKGRLQQVDADYRKALANVGNEAESVSSQTEKEVAAEKERREIALKLSKRVEVRRDIIRCRRRVDFATLLFSLLTALLPIFILGAYYYFTYTCLSATACPAAIDKNAMELGTVTTAAGVFVKLVSSLTMFVVNFEGFTDLLANIERVGVFYEVLEEYQAAEKTTADVPTTKSRKRSLWSQIISGIGFSRSGQ